jgi:acetoin utilization protein AcuC
VSPLALLVVHQDEMGMRFGGDHPTDQRRHQLAVALCRETGLFALPAVAVEPPPPPLADDELARVFAPAFIRAVHRYSEDPILAAAPEASQWGIGGDNNAYRGMHEDSALVSAAAAQAAAAVADGRARRAFVPAAGAHHGTHNRAWGFGIYNETAIAVQWLLDAGLERVAYIDLDVHHGNGTQWIFYENPYVMTVSVHESGRHLFPGSGFPQETGGPGAPGCAANLALPPFAGDDAYRRAMAEFVVPVVAAFGPDAIVTQCGVDHHHADPLAHMLTTMRLYPELWATLDALADECCEGRWVALGGGGYNPCVAPPRAWAALAHRMAGSTPEDPLPERWRETARVLGCDEPAHTWTEDTPPEPEPERDRQAALQVDGAIMRARLCLSPFWPSLR